MNLTWSNVNATEPKKTNLECSYFPCFLSQVCYRPQGKPYYTAVITAILECGGKCQSKIFKENCFRRDPFFPLKSGHADMTPLPRSISYRAEKYEIGTAKIYFVSANISLLLLLIAATLNLLLLERYCVFLRMPQSLRSPKDINDLSDETTNINSLYEIVAMYKFLSM